MEILGRDCDQRGGLFGRRLIATRHRFRCRRHVIVRTADRVGDRASHRCRSCSVSLPPKPRRVPKRMWEAIEPVIRPRASGTPRAVASRDGRGDGGHGLLPAGIFSTSVQLGARGEIVEFDRLSPIELRAVWGRFNVGEFLCSEHDWSWVLLELSEGGPADHEGPALSPAALGAVAAVLRRDRRAASDALAGPRARPSRREPESQSRGRAVCVPTWTSPRAHRSPRHWPAWSPTRRDADRTRRGSADRTALGGGVMPRP